MFRGVRTSARGRTAPQQEGPRGDAIDVAQSAPDRGHHARIKRDWYGSAWASLEAHDESNDEDCRGHRLPVLHGVRLEGSFDDAVRSADRARADLTQRERADDEQLASLRRRLEELEVGRTSMQKDLDTATEVDEQLANEVDKLGGDSQMMRLANGKLADALESAHRRLEEMRRAEASAEDRAALYRDLALKLKGMVDSGDLAITLRDGRMVLTMSNDVLSTRARRS
jgi:hypothetical protein